MNYPYYAYYTYYFTLLKHSRRKMLNSGWQTKKQSTRPQFRDISVSSTNSLLTRKTWVIRLVWSMELCRFFILENIHLDRLMACIINHYSSHRNSGWDFDDTASKHGKETGWQGEASWRGSEGWGEEAKRGYWSRWKDQKVQWNPKMVI